MRLGSTFLIGLAFAIFGWVVVSGQNRNRADKVEPVETAEAVEDAAQMVVDLFHANRELGQEVARLREEVEQLQLLLAEARIQLDVYRSGSAGLDWAVEKTRPVVAHSDITRLQVLDVNRDMMVMVISGGLQAGMKVGMSFSVLRENELLATVRITDVRETIAGGTFENIERNRYPQAGDRLILSRMQD